MKGVAGVVKKVLTWGGIAFLIFYIAYRPQSAATVFKSIGTSILEVANGFGAFLSALVQ
jgi:hypothetical protein